MLGQSNISYISSLDLYLYIGVNFNMYTGSMELFSGNLRTINCFDYQTLKNATTNFHADNFLGSGGFGPVYKVWINIISNNKLGLIEKFFVNNEIANLIYIWSKITCSFAVLSCYRVGHIDHRLLLDLVNNQIL